MKQQDKELILKDLCARSFYSVMVTVPIMSFIKGQDPYTEPIELVSVNTVDMTCTVGDRYAQTSGIKMFNRKGELICKPYLRPMSSMTEEEKDELKQEHIKDEKLFAECITKAANGDSSMRGKVVPHFAVDWCNKNHFDYRGLIELDLALEAPEGMYNLNNE